MNIYARKGDLVRFSHPENGYECDQRLAKDNLVVGEVYTVDHTDVGAFHTSVFLKEVPRIGFNSVLLRDVNTR